MTHYGQRVFISYTGRLAESGEVFDRRGSEDPYEFVMGSMQFFPRIGRELLAMKPGDTREVSLPGKYAYGDFKEDAVRRIPLISMPNWQELEEGAIIEVNSDRAPVPARALVRSIENEWLTLDFNHPLAGKDLVYEVTLERVA